MEGSRQHTHHSSNFKPRKFPIIIICDGVQSPSNIGALFRVCDAFGVSHIVFGNTAVNINSARLQKTARNTQKKVPFIETKELVPLIDKLKEEQYRIIALEISDKSISLPDFSLRKEQKIALIIGNEQQGISNKILDKVQDTIHIEMFGDNSSMNVVQATSIALYAIINKLYIY